MNTELRPHPDPYLAKPRIGLGSIAAAGALAAVFAAVGDVVVYSIGRASGASMVFPYQWEKPPAVLPISVIVSVDIFAAILATIAFGLLVKFTLRGIRVFQIVSVLALLVSFGGPLTLTQTAGSTKATLMAMHVVAAAGIVAVLSLLGQPAQNR